MHFILIFAIKELPIKKKKKKEKNLCSEEKKNPLFSHTFYASIIHCWASSKHNPLSNPHNFHNDFLATTKIECDMQTRVPFLKIVLCVWICVLRYRNRYIYEADCYCRTNISHSKQLLLYSPIPFWLVIRVSLFLYCIYMCVCWVSISNTLPYA